MRVLSVLVILSGAVFGQSNRTACSLTPGLAQQYAALPPMPDLTLSFEERMAPRRALAKAYPADWPLQFLLQEPISGQFTLGREWDAAIAHYRSLPDRMLGEVLEAHLLSGLHKKKSREALDRAMGQASDSPWVHWAMLAWATSPLGDGILAQKEFEEFRRLCPDDLRVFRYLDSAKQPDRVERHLPVLRRTLEQKKKGTLDDEDFAQFQKAWRWERVLYAGRAPEFERLVRSDLAVLRARPRFDFPRWVSAVRNATQELRDPSAMEALENEILAMAPTSLAAYHIIEDRWRKQNPTPQSPQEAPAFEERMMAFHRAQFDRFRGQYFPRHELHRLLFNPAFKLPLDEVETLADAALANAERLPDQGASWPPVEIRVAEVYVNRTLRLGRVPALVQQGLEQIEYQEKYRRNADLYVDQPRGPEGDNVDRVQRRAREILIRHAIITGRKASARALLAEMRRDLEQSKPATAGRREGAWHNRYQLYLRFATQAGVEAPPIARAAHTLAAMAS
ncbi:MAG: hypothetical protein ACRD8O_15985 [Bryobacteraceae bacterium]